MFDLLNRVPRGVATEAIYFAGLRIREREYYRDWRRWLPLRPGDPTFSGSLDAAARLLEEIEDRAGKPLAELPAGEIERWWIAAHGVMEERYERERPSNPVVGDRILAELRHAYGERYVHALA